MQRLLHSKQKDSFSLSTLRQVMSWILVAYERFFFRKKPLAPPAFPENGTKRKPQNHSNQRIILGFLILSAGGKPVLCLQKGILSPSCLPAFGKVVFCSLYRPISHCEGDFSFASERDSHFFDKIILPPFSLYVNHVKLFHLIVFDPRSVRGPGLPPGRSPCPDALLRVR